MKWCHHLLHFVYSMYCSVQKSFTSWAGRSVDAGRTQR